jgi:hypothetical protein
VGGMPIMMWSGSGTEGVGRGLPEVRQVGNAVTAAVAASRWLMGFD